MTDPGRRILTRVGLRIPGWVASESTGAESTNSGHSQGFDRLADIAATAERSGFDSVWVTDNAGEGLGPSGRAPGFEPYTALGALATRTRTVTLGAMVSPITTRNPAVLAKIVTGVDVLSGGRAVLGVGMGASGTTISGKDSANGKEFSSSHPPSTEPRESQRGDGADGLSRLDSLAEGLHICRAMLTEESPTFEGKYYRIEDAHNRPRPVRAGGIPILVGGGDGGRDAHGLFELVARYADAVTVVDGVEIVRDRINALDRLCDEVGRDPAAITRISVGRLVIAPTAKEADQRLDRASEHDRWNHEDGLTIAGSPMSVGDQVGELLEAGIDGVVLTMADAQDLESVELAGATLRSLFG
jgi:alkanesulfonate monooxygenase SsuD/methylene tetrahydromethanopterin reductase-like flavin-dependent oxidoreductase (luciferase family)